MGQNKAIKEIFLDTVIDSFDDYLRKNDGSLIAPALDGENTVYISKEDNEVLKDDIRRTVEAYGSLLNPR